MTSGGKVVDQMYGRFPDAPHQQNFLEAIRSRRRPNADIEIAHPSCTMVHMANIAQRLGNFKLQFDPRRERFIDHGAANKMMKRTYRRGYGIPEQV